MTLETPGTYAAEWSRKNDQGEQEKVAGSLEISDDSPTHLIHLTKDFDATDDGFAFLTGAAETQIYPVIHGHSQSGYYTAIDSRPFRSTRKLGGGLSDIVLRPWLLIKGSVLLHEHELAVTEVRLRFWDQDEWAQWWLWKVKNPDEADPDLTIKQVPIPERSAQVGDTRVSIRDASTRFVMPRSGKVTLEQHSMFHFEFPEPISLREFMTRWMRPVSFFVTSGTRRRSGIESMSITNSTWISDIDGSLLDTWLDVVPQNPLRTDSASEIKFLHRLNDFDFERQLPLAIDVFNAHETAIEQFLDFTHAAPRTPLVRLTTLAQLVETFDRSLTPDKSGTDSQKSAAGVVKTLMNADPALKKYTSRAVQGILDYHRIALASRLSRLDKDSGKLVSDVLSYPNWKSDIALVRNAIVHGLPKSFYLVTNVIPLQISVDILMILFEARLLVALGFTVTDVVKMITVNDPHWWSRKEIIVQHLGAFADFKSYIPPRS